MTYIERAERIALLYQEGYSYKYIRKEMKCSNRYIVTCIEKQGIERRGTKHSKNENISVTACMEADISAGINISEMKTKYRISFYTARTLIETFKETGKLKFGRTTGTKYHRTIKRSEINNEVMPTCIYLNSANGTVLQCGRQLI